MSDCRFGVSPVNYPDPDPDPEELRDFFLGDSFTIFDHEELRDFFLGDFTIFESDFLELSRTDLDLEADPEELCDLFNFDLEDLEQAPFDGSAACDLDSRFRFKNLSRLIYTFFLFSP